MPLSLDQTMASIAKKMEIDYEGLTKQIEHKELRGRVREIVIKHFLKEYFPPALGVESGEIISSKGDVSKQMDVVVFDRFRCPVLIREDEVHVFPIEGVYAVIEVKSFLDSNELLDCVEKIYSAKRMPKEAYVQQKGAVIHTTTLFGREFQHFPTLGFVFAFDSSGLVTLMGNLATINSKRNIGLEDGIDMMCVLKKGVIANRTKEGKISYTPEPESTLCCIETDKSLLLFYLLVMGVLNQAWMPPIKLTEYAQGVEYGTAKWIEHERRDA